MLNLIFDGRGFFTYEPDFGTYMELQDYDIIKPKHANTNLTYYGLTTKTLHQYLDKMENEVVKYAIIIEPFPYDNEDKDEQGFGYILYKAPFDLLGKSKILLRSKKVDSFYYRTPISHRKVSIFMKSYDRYLKGGLNEIQICNE